uniref:C2 domain-containing protein n=1 Tax=Gadus morhua TaxID=8049 RepID=A0A8C5FBV2_GADMO
GPTEQDTPPPPPLCDDPCCCCCVSRCQGSTSSIVSVDCGASGSSRSVTGALELALAYHNTTSCLQVTVRGCQNVSYGNAKKKKCNPYVKIYLETDKAQASKRKTSVKRNTTDPVYNEVLQYQIERHLLSACTLRASVWHSGSLKRKVFLGETLVPLKAWSSEEMTVAWYPLCSKVRTKHPPTSPFKWFGHLKTRSFMVTDWSIRYGVDIGSQGYHRLTVLIKGVKNLPIKANTSQNMDVKGCLTLSRGRKVLSSNLRNGACSDSAQLLFDGLSRSELADCVLVLDVWDHTHLSLTDRPLGGARLDANKTGLPWQTVLQATNKWHDFSLPLVTNVSSRRT